MYNPVVIKIWQDTWNYVVGAVIYQTTYGIRVTISVRVQRPAMQVSARTRRLMEEEFEKI